MFSKLAELLRIPPTHAEAALHSERHAQLTLSRRAFGLAALSTSAAFAFPTVLEAPRLSSELSVALLDGAQREISYVGYARVAMAKGDWLVDGGVLRNLETLTFPQCDGGLHQVWGYAIHDSRGRVALRGRLQRPAFLCAGTSIRFSADHLELKQSAPFSSSAPEKAFDEIVANAVAASPRG